MAFCQWDRRAEMGGPRWAARALLGRHCGDQRVERLEQLEQRGAQRPALMGHEIERLSAENPDSLLEPSEVDLTPRFGQSRRESDGFPKVVDVRGYVACRVKRRR